MSRALATASILSLAFMAQGTAQTSVLFLELDAPTLQVARAAVQTALETRQKGDAQNWHVRGVARGSVIPRRTWRSVSGHWCREFEETVRLDDGRVQTVIATRCRGADGQWKLAGG